MAILFYYYWAFLVLSVTESYSVIPVVVPEHKINIRSTPALDPVEELLEKFGRDNQMNLTQIEKLFQDIGIPSLNNTKQQEEQTCFSSQYFYGMYSKDDGNINRTDLIDLCPAVLYQLSKKECQVSRKEEEKEPEDSGKENPARAWGFGFIFVTVISLGSLIGAFVVPLMDRPLYKKILTFMVSLAVGVLGGSGAFHLIPSALGFPGKDGDHSYLWKCAMVVCGLYLFFVLECSMKLYIRFKTIKRKAVLDLASRQEEKCGDNSSNGVDLEECNIIVNNGHGHSHAGPNMMNGAQQNSSDSKKFAEKGSVEFSGDGNSMEVVVKESSDKKPIATVAWMIIIGDGLHNFIDGLAIGASFSSSVVSGISTSLAVISEELPHELGDFAILLNSGFTYKQAMLANFLSACTCYIGLVIGLVLGYATSAVKYIYGIAGGMFLYISLVDMLPEALEMAYSLSGTSKSKAIKMMLLVNFAMVFGFCVMLVLAKYATSIDL